MPILPNEKLALKELQTNLQNYYDLVDFKLYGSKARGTDQPESDLDVMIILEDLSPEIESEIDDIIFEINLKYDCLITSLYFTRSELEYGALSESPIYKKIKEEGVTP
jgi:predicted nucleotidyltransferase